MNATNSWEAPAGDRPIGEVRVGVLSAAQFLVGRAVQEIRVFKIFLPARFYS